MNEEICFDCGTPHKAGEQCEICAALIRIQRNARENRKQYAIKKSLKRMDESNVKPNLPYADD